MSPFPNVFKTNDLSFLAAFDTNRQALHPAYTPVSTLSFAYDSTIPPQSRSRGVLHKLPNQKNLDWKLWHNAGSRNLMKSTGATIEDIRDKLFTGADDIMVGLSIMPATRHDVSEGEKFMVDAWQMDLGSGPQLFITIHGEFVEREYSNSLAPALGINACFNRTRHH